MKAIIAVTEEGGMGYKGNLPKWNVPGDLLRFKTFTENRIIVMGSNTFFSLPESKRPLPKRTNIVITRHPEDAKFDKYRECPHVHLTTIERFMVDYKAILNDMIVIGGPTLIATLYPYIYQMDVTIIKGHYECDVFFDNFKDLFNWTTSINEDCSDYVRLIFSRTIYIKPYG